MNQNELMTARAKRHCYWTRINARYRPETILRHERALLRAIERRALNHVCEVMK